MTIGKLAQIQLDDDQRVDVGVMLDTLRAAGWQIYHVTTRTDEPMVVDPGAGARYETRACKLDVEYVAMGVSIGIESLGDREDHELLVHGCGRHAGRHNPSQPNDDHRKLTNVLSVLTAYQDQLTPHVYAEFGRELLAACGSIEYYGDESGTLCEFTQENLDGGELPVAKRP